MSNEEPSFWKKYETGLVAAAIGLGTSIVGTFVARRLDRMDYDDDDYDDDGDEEE